MKMYFSGVSGAWERSVLDRAGVEYWLADTDDWKHLPSSCLGRALDSGAYRAWKRGCPILDLEAWAKTVQALVPDFGTVRFVTMPDVLGDPAETWQRWQWLLVRMRGQEWCEHKTTLCARLVPVWQWGGDSGHLGEMVAWAKEHRRIVAIGGCVPWMRDRDADALEKLEAICAEHGKHLHILGLNWLDAIVRLDSLVLSCDTSKWIDGARYGVFISDVGGKLGVERKQFCKLGSDRESLCLQSAITLNEWVNKGKRGESADSGRRIRRYTLNPELRYTGAAANANKLLLVHSQAECEKRHQEAKEALLEQLAFKF